MGEERGQSSVEWIGLLLLVAVLLATVLGAGVRIPGTALARALASRMLCAVAVVDSCEDGPALTLAYGTEVARLVRDHMPTLAFEAGSRAVPVDWRACRSTQCGDGARAGEVDRTDAGLPVTAFVHVVDCREPQAAPGCSAESAGAVYIQYWLYYADSATLRGVPIAGHEGYHPDDWESVQVRVGPDGDVDERASSHHGYNYRPSPANWASDVGLDPVREAEEAVGARSEHGWGPETGVLEVSGGSHAGNVGDDRGPRFTPGGRVRLVPLEPLAEAGGTPSFAISPPWEKAVWSDPEAIGTS